LKETEEQQDFTMDAEKFMNRGLSTIHPYVGGKPREEVEEKYNVEETVKMNSNENPIGVAPAASRYAAEILPRANVYPEGSNKVLRNKIAKNFSLDPDTIVVGNGADEIIYYVAMSFVNEDDQVIIPKLTFPIYEIAFKIMKAKIIGSDMDGYKIDLRDILKKIEKSTKIIVLCNPNNPTGHALVRDEVYEFVEKVPEDVLMVMDEAYMEFADPVVFPDSISLFKKGYKNLFIIRTLSKAYGLAGYRVGYGIADEPLIELINRIKLPFNVCLVSQYAALGALDDEEFVKRTVEITKEGRKEIYRALDRLGLSYVESSTNFIFIDTGMNGDIITEELMKRGVIVRSAVNYGTPHSIRVTVGTEEQNKKFVEALEQIYKKHV
jgi:histidinol-phosphate aminotransferase